MVHKKYIKIYFILPYLFCCVVTFTVPVCKKNEFYDKCSNMGCNQRKCFERVDPTAAKEIVECIGDCVCVKGFLRNEFDICVPENQCRSKLA